MPPGGGDPAPHGPVADWTMARLVEAAAVAGAGGRRLAVDPIARAALAGLCRSGDERRGAEAARLCEGVLVHDAAGRPVAANRRASEMLGGDEADLAARPVGDAAWRCIAASRPSTSSRRARWRCMASSGWMKSKAERPIISSGRQP